MGCKIDELGLSTNEKELAKQYEGYIQAQHKGMLLDPDELAFIEEMENEARAGERSLHIESQVYKVDEGKVQDLNNQSPKIGNTSVKIRQVWVDGDKVSAVVEYPSGHLATKPATSISLDQKNLVTEVLYSEPGTEKGKNYRELLRKEQIRNVATVKATAEMLDELDAVEISKEHKEHLNSVIDYLLNPTLNAIPEMAVYLDEKAKVNGGMIDFTEGKEGIYINTNRDELRFGNEMSAMETYVHELSHAAMHFGFKYGGYQVAQAKRRLIVLKEEAMKVLSVEDFLPDISINKDAELAVAKERFSYVNRSLEEFVAYALTNEKVKNKVKDLKVNTLKNEKPTTFIGKIIAIAQTIMNAALLKWRNETPDTTGEQLLMKLSADIMKVNTRTNDTIQDKLLSKVDFIIGDIDEQIGQLADKVKDKALQRSLKEMPASNNKLEYAKWLVGALGQLMLNKDTYPVLQNVLASAKMSRTGVMQRLVQTIKSSDELSNKMQNLTLKSGQIDQIRKAKGDEISGVIGKAFKRQLKRTEKKALYAGMYIADGNLVVNTYSNAAELYANEDSLARAIEDQEGKLDELVTSKKERKFIDYQINGLAKYMTTGVGSVVQLRNAEAIARLLGLPEVRKTANRELVKTIDMLVSLKAIQQNDSTVNEKMAELLNEDFAGVKSLAEMHRGLIELLDERDVENARLNRPKNYIRETFDDYVTSTVAPLSKRSNMINKGYKLVARLPKSGLQANEPEMGLFVSRDMIRQSINRSAARYTGERQQGRTLFENALKGDSTIASDLARKQLAQAKLKTAQTLDAILNDKEVSLLETVTPEFDADGKIVEYRYNVPMEHKVKYLGMETDAILAAGKTWAHELDVEESAELNKVLWSELMKDMAENFTGSAMGANKYKYVMLSTKSTNKKVADIAGIIPKEFKNKLREAKSLPTDNGMVSEGSARELVGGEVYDELVTRQKENLRRRLADGEIWVREDMLLDTFGFRDLTIADAYLVKELPVAVRTVLRRIENMWKEIIALYKIDIVIKTLPVIMGNIVSNLMYLVQTGFNPVKVVNIQLEAAQELTNYLKRRDEILKLQGLYRADSNKAHLLKIERLQDEQVNSSVHKLVEAGQYQNIIEDVSSDDFKSNSRIANWIGEKTENMPEWVKIGGNWLFVTERTGLFQLIHRLTAKSDFVARYAQYELEKERTMKRFKRENGRSMSTSEVSKLEADLMRQIRDNFINYSRPDSAFFQYLNDIGFVMFTKWAIRIQKIIQEGIAKHPTRFALALIGQEILDGVTGFNPEDPVEKTVFAHGPIDLLYSPSTSQILEALLVPQSIEYARQAL